MKLKVYKIIFYLLLVAALVIAGLIIIKYGGNQINEINNKKIIETFSSINTTLDDNKNINKIQMDGYDLIGIIKIPAIGIEYPILNVENPSPEETKIPMKLSIIKYWGNDVNDYGNLSLAGHNNKDGTMFGKTKKLKIGNTIELIDLNKNVVVYKIYSIFNTDPNDVSILSDNDESIREVTLITCTNGNKERLVLKAREVL